jgi:hypothetical protein
MPFTVSHAAAAYPFRRTRLVWSALIVGTMAPDFEYFVHLALEGRHGHSLTGVFLVTLPLALATLWLFHRFVKNAFIGLMPDALERRLTSYRGKFLFGGARRFALIVASILVGVLTHLAWDSFTHDNSPLVEHWDVMQRPVHVLVRTWPLYKLLQYGSTVLGLAFLALWIVHWYRTAEIARPPAEPARGGWPVRKIVTLSTVVAIALLGACLRAAAMEGWPRGLGGIPHFLIPVVVAAIALLWWQLVLLGILQAVRGSK